jgi:hypothetical protein
MTCPRCAHDTVDTVTTSPVPGIWDVLQCTRCLYLWRTTEPAPRTTRAAFPQEFRITPEDIARATEVPVVPPLRTGA